MSAPSIALQPVDTRHSGWNARKAARWTVPVLAALALSRAASARAVEDQMREAAERWVAGDLKTAHELYLEVVNGHPGHFTALWRLSRVESQLGEETSGEDQRRLVADAVSHARAAIEAKPDSAQGHLALAVALEGQTHREGAKTRLALSREIKSEVDRAIALDDGLGRAYHVRALWNRRLSSLSFFERAAAHTVLGGVPRGASMENAVRDLERAIALEPNDVSHHLELGRTYLQLKRRAEASQELERALALPPTSSPRDVVYHNEARELVGKLRKS